MWCSYEGMSAAVVGSCSGGVVLTAWALHLGATPLMLGTLWALPYLAQLVQPVAAWLTSSFGAKPVAVWATSIARQMLWGLALLPLLVASGPRQTALLGCVGVFAMAGVIGNNAWMTWVAVLVPARLRGRYFGPRNARAMLVGTLASLAVGAYLDAAGRGGRVEHALSVTSAVGAAFGVLCTCLMSRQRATPAAAHVAPVAMLRPFADAGARRVLAFQTVWSTSTGIAASFYSAHALGALGLGVTGFAVYNTALAVLRAAATPLWGRALDRVGAGPVLVVCALLSAAGSAMWVATGLAGTWLIGIDAVLSGIALGGMDLTIFMLPMTLAPRVPTAAFVACTSMVAGLAFGSASILGGAVLGAVSATAPSTAVRSLFALSAIGRVVAAGFAARIGRASAEDRGS